MAFVGGVAGIGLGKLVWGGLGHNLFNPALVGRAFIQAAFPTVLTSWSPQGGPGAILAVRAGNLAAPFAGTPADAVTAATPLGLMKFEGTLTPLWNLLVGNTAGSLGETSAGLILLAGIWLAARRAFDWRIPAAVLSTVAVFSGIVHLAAPASYPSPGFMILAGGLLFGTVFMATDPVTSPMAPRGAWIFGAGVGILVVLIRLWGGLPEGVMYAILLMNAATPLINRWVQPRVFGRKGKP
jgi:electron transport complex protein RnfD